eukprot:128053-Pyramimonas_sp.AAC.1
MHRHWRQMQPTGAWQQLRHTWVFTSTTPRRYHGCWSRWTTCNPWANISAPRRLRTSRKQVPDWNLFRSACGARRGEGTTHPGRGPSS